MTLPPATGFVIDAEFSVNLVLKRTWETMMTNPRVFFGLSAAAALLPAVILIIYAASGSEPGDYGAYGNNLAKLLLSLAAASIFSNLVIQAAIAYGVYRTLAGEDASILSCLWRGLASGLHLVFAALLAMLCLGLGFMLFFIPGVILTCMMFVAIPACAVEKLGPLNCLNRSAELTKGNRLKILGLIILYIVASAILDQITAHAAGLITEALIPGIIINMVVSVIPSTFFGVMVGVTYFDLRTSQEGVGVGALANVFE